MGGKAGNSYAVLQEELSQETPAVGTKQQLSAWVKLIKKVYSVEPLICLKFGGNMKIIIIIMDLEETVILLHHLIKTGESLPGFNPNSIDLCVNFCDSICCYAVK